MVGLNCFETFPGMKPGMAAKTGRICKALKMTLEMTFFNIFQCVDRGFMMLVGVEGFGPPTPASRTQRPWVGALFYGLPPPPLTA